MNRGCARSRPSSSIPRTPNCERSSTLMPSSAWIRRLPWPSRRWLSSPPGTPPFASARVDMTDTLFPYYERELTFIRQFAQDFAKQYPDAAGRLLLEPNQSTDPHIERMVEAFALLAGRIHHKLDDEFPELT